MFAVYVQVGLLNLFLVCFYSLAGRASPWAGYSIHRVAGYLCMCLRYLSMDECMVSVFVHVVPACLCVSVCLCRVPLCLCLVSGSLCCLGMFVVSMGPCVWYLYVYVWHLCVCGVYVCVSGIIWRFPRGRRHYDLVSGSPL